MARMFKVFVSSMFLLANSLAFAAGDYLITMPGPKPGLAKSFKSAGAGKYEFQMDTSKKVSFETIKKSLLKKKMITDVSGDATKIVVSYKGDEKDFLDKVSKARIKEGGGDVDLALESSVSDGGVRARTAARQPIDGEVKGKIVEVVGTNLKVMAQLKGAAGVPADFPMMKPVEVAAGEYKGEKGQTVFFKPTKKVGEAWEGTDFTDK
jgi:hypothetical protein